MIDMRSGRLIVRKNSFLHNGGVHALLIFLAILAGAGGYYIGQLRAGFNLFETAKIKLELKASIDALEQKKSDLRDQLAIVQRSSQVEEEAHQQVKSDLKILQQENVELREEVDFYRGIVAPRESAEGMRIDQFNIDQSEGENLYHFTLVLTQVKKNQRFARGVTTLVFEGEEKGLPKKLELKDVSVDKQKYLKFKFRYFQKFEGDIVLPVGFTPRQVVVEVDSRKKKTIRRHFDWSLFEKMTINEALAKD